MNFYQQMADRSQPTIPDDLVDWRTIYEIIYTYGGIGFGQTVWNVTNDPEFKMNGGDPYGGVGEPTQRQRRRKP